MNKLIKELGGYDAAKEHLKKNSHFINFDGLERFYDAILQYRREHNIFEVGDKVVFTERELKNSRLMTVIEVSEPICGFLMAECSLGITNGFYPSRYRHATDAEIQAGRRL